MWKFYTSSLVAQASINTHKFFRIGLLFIVLGMMGVIGWGQTPVPMASQAGLTYTENFADITNWTNNFTSGIGASRWSSYPITSGGSANDGKRTTKSSAVFVTTTAGGIQKGTGTLVFLSTGSSTPSEAVAVDFLMDFTGVNAGTLSYNWATVDNGSGTRPTSLRVYWSTDNIAFTELTAAQVMDQQSPASGQITTIALPSNFNNSSTARLRFYNHAGTVTGGGNRDKISIDDVTVTATAYAGGGNIGSPGVNWVGQINSYSEPFNCSGGDYRVLNYRRVSVNTGTPVDGRGQWFTIVNVQGSGGNVTPSNMPGGSGAGFLFTNGDACGAPGQFTNKWNFSGVGQTGLNQVNLTQYVQSGGEDMGINMSTAGRYTFVMKDVTSSNGPAFYVGFTTNDPVGISHNTATQQAVTYGNTDITATLSSTPSSQELFYLRYRAGSNDFSSGSTTVAGNVVGTTVTFTIPPVTGGQVVYYYILSTTHLSYMGLSDVDKALSTLRYADNSGSNYSYTMPATPPVATTNNASAITTTAATLNGTVSAGNVNQTVSFNYGLTTAYGTTVAAIPASIAGNASTSVSASITSLSINTLYNYRVSLNDGSVTTNGNNIAFYTLPNVPGKPTVNVALSTSLNVTVVVNSNPGNTEFAIQEIGGSYVQLDGTLGVSPVWQTAAVWGTPVTVKGLTSSTSYSFLVKARNGDNIETAFGAASTAVSTASCATAPTGAVATGITNAGATVSWTVVSSTGYEYAVLTVQTDPVAGDPTKLISTNTDFATGLQSGTTYYLHVRRYCGTNVSSWAHSLAFTTTNAPSGIITWDPALQTSFGVSPWTPTTSDTRITAGDLIRGSAVSTSTATITAANDAWGGYNWDGAANKDVTFDVTPKAGYILSLSGFQLSYRSSNSGPTSGALSYSINGGSFNPVATLTFVQGTSAQLPVVDLTGIASLQNIAAGTIIKFRLLPSGGGTQGTWYIYNEGLVVTGVLASLINPPVATTASPININCFTANWDAATGAGSYRLDVSTSANFSTSLVTSDLIISEYLEGSGNNKYIEIYNGTSGIINTNLYQLVLYSNGSLTPTTTTNLPSFSLAPGSVRVYKNSLAPVIAGAVNNNSVNFNGNDAIVLRKIAGAIDVDIFGRIGEDPGTNGWTAAGGYQTKDKTLIRKSSVTSGITVNPDSGFPTLATEWDILNVDDVSKLGSHSASSPSFVSPYNDYTVNGTSQQVTGLTLNTTYYYRVRAVTPDNITSGNSNVITVATIDYTKADCRSVTTGDYSDPATWEYEAGCGTWTPATQAPGLNNNVTIQSPHLITLDVGASIGTGKTLTVNSGATLNCGSSSFNVTGAGTFTLASGASLWIGSTGGIAATSTSVGNIRTTFRNFSTGANYIYRGSATQSTGDGLPLTVNTLTVLNLQLPTAATLTLTGTNKTINITSPTTSLNLGSGKFSVGNTNTINIPNGGIITSTQGNFTSGAAGGTINFNGLGTVSGTVGFYDCTISGGVDFGTVSSISHLLQLNAGGSVTNGNSPTYGIGSTLVYNTGTSFTASSEWLAGATTGAGVPYNVQLGIDNASSGVTLGNAAYTLKNDLTFAALAGTSLTMSGAGGTLNIGGNWINNAPDAANFSAGAGTILFNGTVAQSLGGTNADAGAYAFYSLTINKLPATTAVTLNQPATIAGVLTLTSGKLITSTVNTLTVNNTAPTAITGGSTSSYINGPLDWKFPINNSDIIFYKFPVGKGTAYLPFTLSKPLTGGVSPIITVEAFTTAAPNPANVDNVTVTSLPTNEHWEASAFGGNFSGAFVTITSALLINAGSVIAQSIDGGVSDKYHSINGTVKADSIYNSDPCNSALGTFAVAASCPRLEFKYPANSYCNDEGTINVSYLNGGSAGVFSSNPALPGLNTNTGAIDLTGTAANTYIIRNSPTSGTCTNYGELTLNISAAVIASAGSPAATCSNSPFTVSDAASNYASLLWSHDGTGTLSNPTTLTPTYTPGVNENGTVTLTLTVTGNSPCGNVIATKALAVSAPPTATITNPTANTSCSNNPITVNDASATYAASILWTHNGTGTISNETTLTPTYTPGTNESGTVTLTLTASNGTCADATATKTLNLISAGTSTWNGSVNNNWNTGGNWQCGVVPNSTNDVVIPSGLTNYPNLTAIGMAHNIDLQNGASITVATNELQIAGTITNNGGFIDAVAGTVTFNGISDQAIAAGVFTSGTIKNLNVSNPAGVTLNTDLLVPGAFDFSNGRFITAVNKTITLGGTYTPGVTLINSGKMILNGVAINFFPGVSTTINGFNHLEVNNGVTVTLNNNLAVGGDLIITNGKLAIAAHTLTLNGSLTSAATKLVGSIASNLVLGGSAKTITLDQSTPTSKYLNSLTINFSSALGDTVKIAPSTEADGPTTGFVKVNSGALTTGDKLVLTSEENGTARIAQGDPITPYIIGKVTVQRFIPLKRAWRLITAPITGNITINQAWQEGQQYNSQGSAPKNFVAGNPANGVIPIPAYGTHITGGTAPYFATPAAAIAAGFDVGVTSGGSPSIRKYGSANFSVSNPATNPDIIKSTAIPLNSSPAYLLFVRGDRTIDPANTDPMQANDTRLRATDEISQNDKAPITVDPNFTLVANPYPSPIDFGNFISRPENAGIQKQFYIWDASLNTLGGYRLIKLDPVSGGYYDVPTNMTDPDATGPKLQDIQSGHAFFIQAEGTVPVSLTIKEEDKSNNVNTTIYSNRFANSLHVNLYAGSSNSPILVDGVLSIFGNSYSAGADKDDITKPNNLFENFSIFRDNRALMIEGRPEIVNTDTIFFRLINTTVKAYQLKMRAGDFTNTGLTAFLYDKFLNLKTPLSLTGSITAVNFSVTTDAASKNPSRFMIVFTANSVLPINFTNVKAYEKGNDIQVEWNLGNEANILKYEIEKSADGRTFAKAGTQAARVIANTNESYNWLDVTPNTGNNFYRIKAIERSGDYKYSQVVNVELGKGLSSISVYPNPVSGHVMNLQFVNQPKGRYAVKLFNSLGQAVYQSEINHAGGSFTQGIEFSKKVVSGIYQLHVRNGEHKVVQKVIIE